ncbi:MAG: hypothetical protein M1814_003604 [Vezdaea aestivalis]|nr:MAG: hypothetical protein M1814_003604 [Vezdaea aestivalis]
MELILVTLNNNPDPVISSRDSLSPATLQNPEYPVDLSSWIEPSSYDLNRLFDDLIYEFSTPASTQPSPTQGSAMQSSPSVAETSFEEFFDNFPNLDDQSFPPSLPESSPIQLTSEMESFSFALPKILPATAQQVSDALTASTQKTQIRLGSGLQYALIEKVAKLLIRILPTARRVLEAVFSVALKILTISPWEASQIGDGADWEVEMPGGMGLGHSLRMVWKVLSLPRSARLTKSLRSWLK